MLFDRNDPEIRKLIFQEVLEEARPSTIMSPPDILLEPTNPGYEEYAARHRAWKEQVIDAEITRRENLVRANENHGILLRLKAFMGGPHGPPVPYGPPEHQAYWDTRLKEERARLGLPP
jgi:hypothetical protein